jgi:hypothetical protein
MSRYLMLRTPSANRVYAGEAGPLTAAELELTARFAREVSEADVAGIGYQSFEADALAAGHLASRCSRPTATCCAPSRSRRRSSSTTT